MNNSLQLIQRNAAIDFLDQLEGTDMAVSKKDVAAVETAVWSETDCLSCAGCCRNMSPAYTTEDMKRIATHLRLSVPDFKSRYLYKTGEGAWMNRTQPCPFLNLETNHCRIYSVRPADCAGFPHLEKSPLSEYAAMHRQNLKFCPATALFFQKLMDVTSAVSLV